MTMTTTAPHAVDAALSRSFEREVGPLRDTLHRHAQRMCRHTADAEDLVQDTMIKAYIGFHSFRPGSNLRAWLFRIMTNTYINGYRKKQRQPMLSSAEYFTEYELAEAHQKSGAPWARHVEDQVLDSMVDNDVTAALQALAPQIREVVFYADVQGFHYKEIAAMMNTPTGTVMSRLHRGRRYLRRLLADAGDDALDEPLQRTA
jgi:RNA polymerase sigma-70 factor, ECF subfamily